MDSDIRFRSWDKAIIAAGEGNYDVACVLSSSWEEFVFAAFPLDMLQCAEATLLRLHMNLHKLKFPHVSENEVWLNLRKMDVGDSLFGDVYYFRRIWVHKIFRELGLHGQIAEVIEGTRERIDQHFQLASAALRLTLGVFDAPRQSTQVVEVSPTIASGEMARLNYEEAHDRYLYFSSRTFIQDESAVTAPGETSPAQEHYQRGQI